MITAIGIIGAAIILVAFFLNQTSVWKSESVTYEFTNFIGAVFLTWYSWLLHSWPFLALNIIWGGVALYEMIRHLRGHRPEKKSRAKIGHKIK